MGRSQVLYNRTKGRYKSRGAAGRGGRGGGEGAHTNSQGTSFASHKNRNSKSNYQRDTPNARNEDEDDDSSTVLSKRQHDREQLDDIANESMVLLDDASMMTAQRSYFYGRGKNEKKSEETAAFSILEAGGSINVPSMAATFSTLGISKRLKLPKHLVALAFGSKEETSGNRNEDAESEDVGGRLGHSKIEDDVMSYTIVGTRNRATILSDGQVEVRSTLKGTSRLKEEPPLMSSKSKTSSKSPTMTEENNIADKNKITSKTTKKLSKQDILQVISDDDPEEDKYFVLEASTTTSSSPEKITHDEASTSHNLEASKGTAVREVDQAAGELQELEAWLDQTMNQTGDEKEDKAHSKSFRPFMKMSKIPGHTYDTSPRVNENEVEGQGDPADEKTRKNLLMRQRYQKQRLRQQQKQQQWRTEPKKSSASGTVEEYNEDDDHDEKLYETSKRLYGDNFVDTAAKLFQDSKRDGNLSSVHKSTPRPSSAEKKNAMRDYVIHTTHHRKLKSPTRAVAAKLETTEDGEDLDKWLDSVIE
jgi:hypothetical protein